mgnify:CR=1 FL=1
MTVLDTGATYLYPEDLQFDEAPLKFSVSSGTDLVDDVAALIASGDDGFNNGRDAFLGAILKRIKDIEPM